MQSITGAVKNAKEARGSLQTKGWITLGEKASLDTLTRVLFTSIAAEKIPPQVLVAISSVAYLLTKRVEKGILSDMTDRISTHIKDTLDLLTLDLHVKLDQHVKAANKTAQSQAALTDKLLLAQKNLDETTQKALMNTKIYS